MTKKCFLTTTTDRQSLIQVSSGMAQQKFLRVIVELQRRALQTFHRDLSDENERNEWFGSSTSGSRNLAVLTSCPEIFTWIHSEFSDLLFQLFLLNFKDEAKPEYFVPLLNDPEEEVDWNLRKILSAFPDPDQFKEILFRFISGGASVCFLAPSDKDLSWYFRFIDFP